VPPSGFARRSAFRFELDHATQAEVVKRAHDHDSCIIEFHSHLSPATASFSGTDISGLCEWVPHVRWRLQQRPYAALVVVPGTFDALLFSDTGSLPRSLNLLTVGEAQLRPTGITIKHWEVISDG
jgi:hypothetical protein